MNGTLEATRKNEVECVCGGGKTPESIRRVCVKVADATVRLSVRISALLTLAVTPGKSTSLCLSFRICEMGVIIALSLWSCLNEIS